MPVIHSLHDKIEIARFLQEESERRLYELGDLDPFFWPYTTWYGLRDQHMALQQLLLLYIGGGALPVLLCTGRSAGAELLKHCKHLLPSQFYTHILPAYTPLLQENYAIDSHGLHYKYALHSRQRLQAVLQEASSDQQIQRLRQEDLPAILTLYQESYPDNSFDPRMLETEQFYGIWQDQRLACIAGIHVYSPEYQAATVGNVTTHPVYRGRGLGKHVCAYLCQQLTQHVEHIGLNVKADNVAAIAIYEQLGFERVETYEELLCLPRPN